MLANTLLNKKNLILAVVLVLFAVLCMVVQFHPYMTKSLKSLRVGHVPSELLSYNKLGELFHSLGLVNVVPNHSDRYKQKYDAAESDELGPFQKRRQISGALLESGEKHQMMDAAMQHITTRKNRTAGVAISVVTEPENIRGEQGVITNHQKRGRNWERLGYVAIEKGDQLVANSAVGIRLHGGESRDPSLKKHSYRLYFRKIYGNQWLDTSSFFADADALRTLVVHVDIPENWPLNNVIANRIYSMIGVPTIEYSQAEFFLNGKNQGLYWLSQHLSEKYLKAKYGLSNIHYQRYRGQEKNPVYREDISMLESEAFIPLTYEKLGEIVDVEGMIDYFIAVTFSGNTDWNQGVGFKDADDPSSRWKWVAWDLDHSFIDWYVKRSRNPNRKVWQQDGLGLIFDTRLHKVRSKRQRLFRRLFEEDPTFQQRFVERYVNTLNHDLRVEKLVQLYEEYVKITADYDMKINPQLLAFFKNRHPHMRWELQQYFKIQDFQKLTISGDASQKISINGFVEKLPFVGHYPEGMQVTIEVGAGEQQGGGKLIVDGTLHDKQKMVITMAKHTMVGLQDP